MNEIQESLSLSFISCTLHNENVRKHGGNDMSVAYKLQCGEEQTLCSFAEMLYYV
jgi:hypothetical protein